MLYSIKFKFNPFMVYKTSKPYNDFPKGVRVTLNEDIILSYFFNGDKIDLLNNVFISDMRESSPDFAKLKTPLSKVMEYSNFCYLDMSAEEGVHFRQLLTINNEFKSKCVKLSKLISLSHQLYRNWKRRGRVVMRQSYRPLFISNNANVNPEEIARFSFYFENDCDKRSILSCFTGILKIIYLDYVSSISSVISECMSKGVLKKGKLCNFYSYSDSGYTGFVLNKCKYGEHNSQIPDYHKIDSTLTNNFLYTNDDEPYKFKIGYLIVKVKIMRDESNKICGFCLTNTFCDAELTQENISCSEEISLGVLNILCYSNGRESIPIADGPNHFLNMNDIISLLKKEGTNGLKFFKKEYVRNKMFFGLDEISVQCSEIISSFKRDIGPLLDHDYTDILMKADFEEISLIAMSDKFDEDNSPYMLQYIKEYWGSDWPSAVKFVLRRNTGVVSKEICNDRNWKRKRFISDFSAIRVKCGYPRLCKVDLNIPPTKLACKFISKLTWGERRMESLAIKKWEDHLHDKMMIRDYKKVISECKADGGPKAVELLNSKTLLLRLVEEDIKKLVRHNGGANKNDLPELDKKFDGRFKRALLSNKSQSGEEVKKPAIKYDSKDYIVSSLESVVLKRKKKEAVSSLDLLKKKEKELVESLLLKKSRWRKKKSVEVRIGQEYREISVSNMFSAIDGIKEDHLESIEEIDDQIKMREEEVSKELESEGSDKNKGFKLFTSWMNYSIIKEKSCRGKDKKITGWGKKMERDCQAKSSRNAKKMLSKCQRQINMSAGLKSGNLKIDFDEKKLEKEWTRLANCIMGARQGNEMTGKMGKIMRILKSGESGGNGDLLERNKFPKKHLEKIFLKTPDFIVVPRSIKRDNPFFIVDSGESILDGIRRGNKRKAVEKRMKLEYERNKRLNKEETVILEDESKVEIDFEALRQSRYDRKRNKKEERKKKNEGRPSKEDRVKDREFDGYGFGPGWRLG